MARGKAVKSAEDENRDPYPNGQNSGSESREDGDTAKTEGSFLDSITGYFFGADNKEQCDIEKGCLSRLKDIVDKIDFAVASGDTSLFNKDIGAIYLPFACEDKVLKKSNGSGAHLIKWARNDIGIRACESSGIRICKPSNVDGQCDFEMTDILIRASDIANV